MIMESKTRGGTLPRFDRSGNRRSKLKLDWYYWPDTSSQRKYTHDSAADSSTFSRPDIEDNSLIAWGLAQSQATDGAKTTIDVLCGEGVDLRKRPLAIETTYMTYRGTRLETQRQ